MRRASRLLYLLWLLVLRDTNANSYEGPPHTYHFTSGPAQVAVGEFATLQLPPDTEFLADPDETQTFLWDRAYLNFLARPEAQALHVLTKEGHWQVVFSYENTGPVNTEAPLDPDALLATLKAEQARQNALIPYLDEDKPVVLDWQQLPRFDQATRRLSWAIRYRFLGTTHVQYRQMILGQSGAVLATLESHPGDNFEAVQAMLQGLTMTEGGKSNQAGASSPTGRQTLATLIAGGPLVEVSPTLLARMSTFLTANWATMLALLISLGAVIFALISKRRLRQG